MGATKPLIIAYAAHPAGTRLPIKGTMPAADTLKAALMAAAIASRAGARSYLH